MEIRGCMENYYNVWDFLINVTSSSMYSKLEKFLQAYLDKKLKLALIPMKRILEGRYFTHPSKFSGGLKLNEYSKNTVIIY